MSGNTGKDAVRIGRVEGDVGDGSVVIGATDQHGNTVLNQPMVIGKDARGGPDSIVIGAGADGTGTQRQSAPVGEVEGMNEVFVRKSVELARQSKAEDDRVHPKVGVVVVKNGTELESGCRGETGKGDHAEYGVMEKKIGDDHPLVGATVYTTLEPCTTRKHPKVPCAERLVERRVARVFIGMLDPNPEIRGNGVQQLQKGGIEVQLYEKKYADLVLEMNREFTRDQEAKQANGSKATSPDGGDVEAQGNLSAGDGGKGDGGAFKLKGGDAGPGGRGGGVDLGPGNYRAGDGGSEGGKGGDFVVEGGKGG